MDVVDLLTQLLAAVGALPSRVTFVSFGDAAPTGTNWNELANAAAAPVVALLVGFLAWINGRANLKATKTALTAAAERHEEALREDREGQLRTLRQAHLAKVLAALSAVDALNEAMIDKDRTATVDQVNTAVEQLRAEVAQLELALPPNALILRTAWTAIGQMDTALYEPREMTDLALIEAAWDQARDDFNDSMHRFRVDASKIVRIGSIPLDPTGAPYDI
jgi:hypothetical protein